MTNSKSTKRALLSSVLALCVCFAMLLGTTFAWFTDTAVSANNKIVSGKLDVELYHHTSTGSVEVSESRAPVFPDDILWEPGYTHVEYLSIKNAGTLPLKYKVDLVVTAISEASLLDVMSYTITPDAQYGVGEVPAWAGNGVSVIAGNNDTQAVDVTLAPGAEHFFALSVHMDENAGNKYMGQSVAFDIRVIAGQVAENADYPESAEGKVTITEGTASFNVEVKNQDGYKAGAAEVPAAAVAEGASEVAVTINESSYVGTFTIAQGLEKSVFDVSATGIKEGNTTPIKTQIRIATGLDPATVSVYHYDTIIPSTYDPADGYVTFDTTSFSPFTVVYDAESEFVAPEVGEDGVPTASVSAKPEFVGVSLPWGSYGQWSPNEEVDGDPKLEAAYVFACTETLEEAKLNDYANWNCDFYVKLDRALGENQIFLGGNYGSFGWVGFHNGDVTLDANTEIGLLGSVTTNPWTYLDVVQNVKTFTCGVGDVNDALSGATFTVTLRLTNPSNDAEYKDIAVITHTFQ